MLEIKNLKKSYGNLLAVNDISFQLEAKEIFGLVGTNGSGKTTTFRMILQLLKPDSGEIIFNGVPLQQVDRNIFAYLPEERSLYRELSVNKQLMFLGSLKGMSSVEINQSIAKWASILEVEDLLEKPIKQLSKGNQQKVQFMGCLLHDPQVYIFDEPFSGLDAYNLELLKKVFFTLQKEGKHILLSTHRLDHVQSFCSKMLFIKNGETVLQGSIDTIRQKEMLRYVRVMGEIPGYVLNELSGVDNIVYESQIKRLEFHDEQQAKRAVTKLLKREGIISLQYELPTLQDIFLRYNYEKAGMQHD